jgi:hypothetical protein
MNNIPAKDLLQLDMVYYLLLLYSTHSHSLHQEMMQKDVETSV